MNVVKCHSPDRRGISGFSLMELLVVIAAISILATMLFPVLSSTLRSARITSCMNQQQQLSAACMLYAGDYASFLPLRKMPDPTAANYGYLLTNTATYYLCYQNPDWNNQSSDGLGHLFNLNYIGWDALALAMCPDFFIEENMFAFNRIKGGVTTIAGQPTGFGPPPKLHAYAGFSINYCNRRNTIDSPRLSAKRWKDNPLFMSCAFSTINLDGGAFSYNPTMNVGGMAHALNGINISFVDGHTRFYTMSNVHNSITGLWIGKWLSAESPNASIWNNWKP